MKQILGKLAEQFDTFYLLTPQSRPDHHLYSATGQHTHESQTEKKYENMMMSPNTRESSRMRMKRGHETCSDDESLRHNDPSVLHDLVTYSLNIQ